MENQDNRLEAQDSRRNENSSSSKGFILGAIIGGIVGAATALYLSPKSGSDFREQASQLLEKGEKIRNIAMSKGTDILTTAKERTTVPSKNNIQNDTMNKDGDLGVKKDQTSEIKYVSIVPKKSPEEDVQKKLLEAQLALEAEENKIKL
jgi:gas vesicle protein